MAAEVSFTAAPTGASPIQQALAKHLMCARSGLREPTGPNILTRTLASEVGEEGIGLAVAGLPCLSTGKFSGPAPPILKTEISINNTL